jgi:hypothetical protein
MKEFLYLYIVICVIALMLKFCTIALIKILRQHGGQKLTHEQEHSIGHIIKFIIVILIGIALTLISRGSKTHENDSKKSISIITKEQSFKNRLYCLCI